MSVGFTWAGTQTNGFAVSADGKYMLFSQMASAYAGYGIVNALISSDYGATFTTITLPNTVNLAPIQSNPVMSSNGQLMFILGNINTTNPGFYRSIDYGQTWTWNNNSSLNGPTYLAASASCQYMAATAWNGGPFGANNGGVYVTNDYGKTWTYYNPNGTSVPYSCVSVSPTGQYMLATTNYYQYNSVAYSSNYGVTWSSLNVGLNASVLCAMSANGQYMLFSYGYSGATGVKYITLPTAINQAGSVATTSIYGNVISSSSLVVNKTSASFGSYALDISGNLRTTSGAMSLQAVTDTATVISFLNAAGTVRGSVGGSSATAVTYNTSSDKRRKENITPMPSMIHKIKQLQPRTYTWKESGDKDDGFIAQEVHKVFPQFMTSIFVDCAACKHSYSDFYDNKLCSCCDFENPVDKQGNPAYYGLDYGRFTPYLTKALQEVIEIAENQQVQIHDLQSQVDAMSARLSAAGIP
jgi:hypothetical protein